jgi:hypothetical protein
MMKDFQPGWNTTVLPKEPSAPKGNLVDDELPF